MKIKTALFCITFLITVVSFSQNIKGVVLDKNTNLPVYGASVYFDNTTIGTSTNENGEFSLPYKEHIKSALIVSFIGYQTIIIDDYEVNKLYKILLEEDINALDEIVITNDDIMPEALKLEHFKREFLGFSKSAKSCVILNENDLILQYSHKKRQLTARAVKPVKVNNKHLQYLVSFDIQEFIINYDYVNLKTKQFKVQSVTYTGTTFYQSLENENNKTIIKNRNKAYQGSIMHFMRAISKKTLEIEGYQIFSSGFKVNPDNYINVQPQDSTNNVVVKLLKPVSVLYNKKRQSSVQSFVSEFIIDQYGNYSPIGKVMFGGDMGEQRVGDLLPVDYEYVEK